MRAASCIVSRPRPRHAADNGAEKRVTGHINMSDGRIDVIMMNVSGRPLTFQVHWPRPRPYVKGRRRGLVVVRAYVRVRGAARCQWSA
jgi:hypothetical protein